MDGSVLQLVRDRPEERSHDDDGDRQPERRLRQGDPERVAEQPDLAQHDEQRQDGHGHREQQPEREQAVDELAALERVAGDDVGGERGGRQHDEHGEQGDDRAVADLAPERAGGEDRRVVLADPRVGQADRVLDQLDVGAESAEDRERQRDDDHGEDRPTPRGRDAIRRERPPARQRRPLPRRSRRITRR